MKRHSIDPIKNNNNNNNELILLNSTIRINEIDNNNNSISLDDIIKRRRQLQDFCVRTETQLRVAVSNAPNFFPTRD